MRLNLPPVPPPSISAPSLPIFSRRSPYRPFLYRSEATGGGYGARRAIPPAPPAAPRRIRYFLGSATGVARRSDPFLSLDCVLFPRGPGLVPISVPPYCRRFPASSGPATWLLSSELRCVVLITLLTRPKSKIASTPPPYNTRCFGLRALLITLIFGDER